MEEKSVVELWDLPEDKVYVKIKDEIRIQFFNFVINQIRNVTKLSQLIGIKSVSNFYAFKRGQYSIPLRILNKMLNLLSQHSKDYFCTLLKSNIKEIRSTPPSKAIEEIKFPIKASLGLTSLIGHIIGDGGFGKKNDTFIIHYTNKSKVLSDSFKKDVIEVFGDTHIYEYIDKRKNAYRIQLPNIVGIILQKFCGYQSGDFKHVPEWVISSDIECKKAFIRALFDDEGTVGVGAANGSGKFLSIGMINRGVIKTLKEMLKDFGISANKVSIRKTPKGKDCFYLTITGKHDLEKFNEFIGFENPEKKTRLNQIIGSYRIDSYKRGEMEDLIIQSLLEYGGMNIYDLCRKINRKPEHRIRSKLIDLRKRGLIKSKSIGESHLKIYYPSR